MEALAVPRKSEGLTPQQRTFVAEFVSGNGDKTRAARIAGYADPGREVFRLLSNPNVLKAVHDARARLLDGDLATVALSTMRDLMDKKNPGNVRFQAAKYILDAAGHGAKSDEGRERPLNEMSADELSAFITKLDEAHSKIADNALPARKVIENGQGTNGDNAG